MVVDLAVREDGWCILRCAGASTMRLAASLAAAGIEAWSPVKTVRRKKAKAKAIVEKPAPIMPTFVFARARHVGELQRMRMLIVSPHPSFSIFRHLARIPIIADRDIAALRAEEDRDLRDRAKRRHRSIPIGAKVTPTEGAWAGMTGVVEDVKGKSAKVNFGGNYSVCIAAWLLPDNQLEAGSSSLDRVA